MRYEDFSLTEIASRLLIHIARVKRSRALDPFESKKIHSGTTGLVENWRLRLTPAATPPRPPTIHTSVTPEHEPSVNSGSPTPMNVCLIFYLVFSSIPTATIQVDDPRSVYKLPEVIDGQKVYPGIKDLPTHIRANFRNEFIHYVIRDVFNSEHPWVNPDLQALQHAYDQVYLAYPARIRHNDAVSHPVSTFSLFTACNRVV